MVEVYPHLPCPPASQKNAVTITSYVILLCYVCLVLVLVCYVSATYIYNWHIDVICLFDFITASIRLVYIFVMDYLTPYTLDLSCVYSGWQTHGLCHAVMFISITDIWHITVICHSTMLRGYVVDKDYICYWYAVFPGLCWYIR